MDAVAMNPTPTHNGSRLKIFYATQVAVKPPTFVVFVNEPDMMHFSYERFLENRLREAYDFFGNPIRIQMRGRPDTRRGQQDRKTAAERAPDRRKPVKKGPGSKPTNADRARQKNRGPLRTAKRGVKPGTKSRKR